MRVLCITAAVAALTACGPSHKFTIVDQLCDGGTQTYTIPGQTQDSTLDVNQQCGSPAQTSILSAPCVTPADGGAPVATFTLPAGFDPGSGDSLSASVCSAQCFDAGEVCNATSPPDRIVMKVSEAPIGGSTVQVDCSIGAAGMPGGSEQCRATEAFLQITK